MPSQNKLSDEQLVVEVRQAGPDFFALLINRYQEKLMRYVLTMVGDEARARDLVQETFIKAYINLNGFDTSKKFSSWIYRIAHNQTLNSLKKNRRETQLEPDWQIKDPSSLPEENFIKKEIRQGVRSCLGQVPYKYREPLTLHYILEKSYQEISDIMRLPLGTVGTRINRGKIIMHKLCQQKLK